jgi:hypothetical protein
VAGGEGSTTLIDAVHTTILAYILVATGAGVLAWRRFLENRDLAALQRLERRMAGISTAVFGGVILALVALAMHASAR